MKSYQIQVLANKRNNGTLFFQSVMSAILAMTLMFFGQTIARAANGYDFSFGAGGKVITDLTPGSLDEIYKIVRQPDNKIVAMGTAGGLGDSRVISSLDWQQTNSCLPITTTTGGRTLPFIETEIGGFSTARQIRFR